MFLKKNTFKEFFLEYFYIFFLLPIFFLMYYIRYKILNYFNLYGLIYLSVLISSLYVIKLFNLLKLNFENYIAIYQHILINLFITNKSIGSASEKTLILDWNYKLTFNVTSFIESFLMKFKNADKLLKAIKYTHSDLNSHTYLINNHFTKLYQSSFYPDKNLANSLTSTSHINVLNDSNQIEKIDNDFYFYPNAVDKDKVNSIIPNYELDLSTTLIKPIDKLTKFNFNKFTHWSAANLINHKDDKIIYSKDGIFYKKNEAPTVYQYCEDAKLDSFNGLKLVTEFEKDNEELLSTQQGQSDYNVFKMMIFTEFYFKFK